MNYSKQLQIERNKLSFLLNEIDINGINNIYQFTYQCILRNINIIKSEIIKTYSRGDINT